MWDVASAHLVGIGRHWPLAIYEGIRQLAGGEARRGDAVLLVAGAAVDGQAVADEVSARVLGKKAAEGVCSEPRWFWGSTGENFWVVEAEFEVLLGLMATPEVQGLLLKGGILAQDFDYGLYQVGREEMLVPYEQALAGLKIK